ncbi:MAG: GNAT family N-acetyltransferase, partial [Thermoplasmatota archaeon]
MRSIRRGTKADVPFLRALEAAAFEPHRRSSPAVLRRHFASPRQTVWILDDAALVLWNHKQFLRLYSLAVHPDAQGKGLGAALMQHAHELAKKEGKKTVLEVEATNQ